MINPIIQSVAIPNFDPETVTLAFFEDNDDLKENFGKFVAENKISLTHITRQGFLDKDDKLKCNNGNDEFVLFKSKPEDISTDFFRNSLAGFFSSLSAEVKKVNIILPNHKYYEQLFPDANDFYQSLIEGVHLGSYKFDRYLSKKEERTVSVNLVSSSQEKVAEIAETTLKVINGVFLARELANEPANVINPVSFADRIVAEFSQLPNTSVEIFDEEKLKEIKMGGILSVGKGSATPPRLAIIKYNPLGALKNVALVGKGVTFDSGGISIKPAQNMGWMKADMAGAAAVTGAMLNIISLELPVAVTAVLPLAENMLSGNSYRPGDIVTTYSQKTVEVDNTDAEGRIILADALWYASALNPDILIDLATLTGAAAVALGDLAAALFTKNDELATNLISCGEKTRERLWRLPLWDEYNELINSNVADVKNTGGRYGGAVTAAKFLEKFVQGDTAWAHLDIAGPAITNKTTNYTKTWMTGFGVRLLTDFIRGIK